MFSLYSSFNKLDYINDDLVYEPCRLHFFMQYVYDMDMSFTKNRFGMQDNAYFKTQYPMYLIH